MKVAVYGVAKNEEHNVADWYESIKDADYILLMDTGSSDDTMKIAKSFGINVVQAYFEPWDETMAKNAAMSLIPKEYEYCLNLDLDQRVVTVGWKNIIAENATKKIAYCDTNFANGMGDDTIQEHKYCIHSRYDVFWFGYRPRLSCFTEFDPQYLNIKILNVVGDQTRYNDREPLYIQSFLNHYDILRRYQQNNLITDVLRDISLSYFEIENLQNFNIYYNKYIESIDEKDKNEIEVHMPIMLAYSLSNPSDTTSIYEKIDNMSISHEWSVYYQMFMMIRKAILSYCDNNLVLLKSILQDLDTLINNNSNGRYLSELEKDVLDGLKNFLHNNQISESLIDKIIILFGNIQYGKNHKELSLKALKHMGLSHE